MEMHAFFTCIGIRLRMRCMAREAGIMAIETSICILTYNRCSSITRLIDSIYPLIGETTEIIVVDNNSSDNTEIRLRQYKKIRYFKSEKNIGASGRNIAFRNAKGGLIICLDDDVFGISEEDIALLNDKLQKNRDIGAINFKVIDAFSRKICNWVHHCRQEEFSDKEFLTYEITEGAVAFRKKALDKAGYYDDIYFISHEGPDLAFRIMRAGYDCIYTPEITVEHRHESSGRVSWLNYYYDTRNHFYLAFKNFPPTYAFRYLSIAIPSMFVYSVRDGFFKYWIKGVYHGIRDLAQALPERHVLPEQVMSRIELIDRNKAPLIYKVRSRLFRKTARL